MHITHIKSDRDHLGAIHPNSLDRINGSKQKQVKASSLQSQGYNVNQIGRLHNIIDSLKTENQTMNAMIREKNQQIGNLKGQIKNGSQEANNSNQKEVYYFNNFTNNRGETAKVTSGELDKAMYQVRVVTKERDDLAKLCQQLQQQIARSVPFVSSLQGSYGGGDLSNPAKIIERYEEHIAAMASKLSTVHKLQNEIYSLNNQNKIILSDYESLRQQLINRVGYCEHLENQIRNMEENGVNSKKSPEYENLLRKTEALESQMAKMSKQLKDKEAFIADLALRNSGYVQVTKEAFQSMQSNISSLQEKVGSLGDSHRRQAEKSSNLQIQLDRAGRELKQKIKRIESGEEKIRGLQSERIKLMTSFETTKSNLERLQKKFDSQSEQLDKATKELNRKKQLSNIRNEFTNQIEMERAKNREAQKLIRDLRQSVSKLEQKIGQVQQKARQAEEHTQECYRKYEHFERVIKQQNQYIVRVNENSNKRIEELDTSIKYGLNLQAKLRELTKKNDSLTDQIEQFIKENYYNGITDKGA